MGEVQSIMAMVRGQGMEDRDILAVIAPGASDRQRPATEARMPGVYISTLYLTCFSCALILILHLDLLNFISA